MRKTKKEGYTEMKVGIIIYEIIFLLIFFTGILVLTHFNEQYFLDIFNTSRNQLPGIYHYIFWCVWSFIALCWVLSYYKRDWIYTKRKEVALFLVVSLFCFGLLELGSHFYLCGGDDYRSTKLLTYGECGLKSRYTGHPYVGYVGTPDFVFMNDSHNSLGFRGPELRNDSEYRIVVTGGSTVYSTGVESWHDDFARQLEKNLKELTGKDVEVINSGLGGWTSYEMLSNLEYGLLDLKPNLIITYEGINDIHTRMVNPETYKCDNTGRRKVWEVSKPKFPFNLALTRALTNINPTGLGTFVNKDGVDNVFMENITYSSLGGTPQETLEKNIPICYQRNMANFIVVSKVNNINLLLMTFANNNDFKSFDSLPWYQFGLNQHNQIITGLGAYFQVPVFDFANVMDKDVSLWKDGVHLSKEGEALKGKLVADYIVQNDVGGINGE